nr:hypothetical protein [uncultured Kingella sp.]
MFDKGWHEQPSFPTATHAGAMVKQPEMPTPRPYGLLASRVLALKIAKAA